MNIVELLKTNRNLDDEQLKVLLETDEYDEALRFHADEVRKSIYSKDVYLRGLIEFTNICKNDCCYCGIRCSNSNVIRYRLSQEQIMECCREGYALGYRTFVLQGGEDPYFDDDKMCSLISKIRQEFADCAITLSVGEKSGETYRKYFESGANRYLLRHETADPVHYAMLHPDSMSLENRKRCLSDLKEIGFQTGSGFMVGSPFQTTENLISDLRFLQKLEPDMIGIGPFIPAKGTPFEDKECGSFALTIKLISVLRLMFPYALIPSTTALGTIHPQGREMGLKAGANVVMPNLSPVAYRDKYSLYDNKICTGEESAQCRCCLEARVASAGYKIVSSIGNVKRV